MANDTQAPDLTSDEAPKATVIARVAEALEDTDAGGDGPTIVLDTESAATAPLPPRRGS
jgi:hypothetical protein